MSNRRQTNCLINNLFHEYNEDITNENKISLLNMWVIFGNSHAEYIADALSITTFRKLIFWDPFFLTKFS